MASLSGHAESQVRLSDIVFANDQSGSMALNHVWISPDLRDTIYLSGTGGCQAFTNADLNNYGSVTVLNQMGTRQVNRINPNKSVATCSEFSGDPFSQRALAFREALDFQAFHAPGSRAGYMGFSEMPDDAVLPLTLDSPANLDSIKSRIIIREEGRTNYHIALSLAKQWLADPALSPNPVKALIFLSDGRPNTPNDSSYLEVLSSTYAIAPGPMPPIHGIFLGNSNPDSARLQELSRLTGGLFFVVPPRRPDSLRTVLTRVIGSILNLAPTTGTRIPQNVIVPNRAPTLTAFARHLDGTLLINLSPHAETNGIADFLGRIRSAE